MDGVLYLGNIWYRGKGAQEKVKSIKKVDEVIVAFHTKKLGRGWTNMKCEKLLKLIQKNRGLYEVLTQYPKKVYFDIDFENPPDNFNQSEFIENTIKEIREYLPDIEFAISGSVSPDKASFHYVSTNYIIKNEEQLDSLKLISKAIFLKFDAIDWKVYTKNRQMKIINQSKPNKPVQQPITSHDFKCHLINSFFTGNEKEVVLLNELSEASQMLCDLASNNTIKNMEITTMKLPNPDNITWDELLLKENATKLLSLIPLTKEFSHNHTYRVCNFCITNDIPKSMFLSWLKKKDPANIDRIEKYNKIHYNNIKNQLNKDKNFCVSIYKMRGYLPNWYPNIKPKNIEFKKFLKNWLPDDITYIDKIDLNSIETNNKFIFYSNPMGSGKTNTLIEYLHKNETQDFVWIAPRITLLDDTNERMEKSGIKTTHYKTLGNKQNKTFVLKYKEKTPNLLICLNSIHYLLERDYMPDILVIDELETILSTLCQVDDIFLKTADKINILKTLKYLISCASKVICLDAFTTKRSINFMLSLDNESEIKNHIVYDTKQDIKNPLRNIIHIKDEFKNIINKIIQNLYNGKKIVVFYPFKKGYKEYPSMEDLLKTIKKRLIKLDYNGDVDKECICYNGDTIQSKKNTIKDVNLNWENKKLVMFNTVITAGVSYSNDASDFDETFLFIAPFNSPRDIAQVSYRLRRLTSNNIYLFYIKGRAPDAWKNDTADIRIKQYSKLFENSMIEFKSPLRQTLMLFFGRCNYNVKQPIKVIGIDDAIKDNIEASDDQTDLYSYETIGDLAETGFKDILHRQVMGQDVDADEKLSVRKYVFKSHFLSSTPPEILKKIWNNDKLNIIEILNKANKNENSFESILARDNEWDFFPYIENATRRWNIKISDEVKDKIFQEWELLRFEKNTKKTGKLLKTIYNTKYKTNVIDCEFKDKNVYFNTEQVEELNELAQNVKDYYQGSSE